MFDIGRKQIEKYFIEKKKVQPTRDMCMRNIKSHFANSNNEIYARTMK
jgi:hypothetical protein